MSRSEAGIAAIVAGALRTASVAEASQGKCVQTSAVCTDQLRRPNLDARRSMATDIRELILHVELVPGVT